MLVREQFWHWGNQLALSPRTQLAYWLSGAFLLAITLWLLGDVLLPFVIGMALAYFLDPIADRLEAAGFSRVLATLLITLVAILVVLILIAVLVPMLINQAIDLAKALPDYLRIAREFAAAWFPDLMEEGSFPAETVNSMISQVSGRSAELAGRVLSVAVTIVDILVIMVVSPVVAVYMLLDWDRMIATIDGWLPRDHQETVRSLVSEVDAALASFVRGQFSVCAILAVFYAVSLMLVGLEFGLVIGVAAGALTFIPYVGAVIGGLLSIGLALFQFWDSPILIGVVALIFVVGQAVEGNFLTPKLVGKAVGLHPVWLIFALAVFGTLFGFTGLLLAVPITACIGVFSSFALRHYLAGRLYQGRTHGK